MGAQKLYNDVLGEFNMGKFRKYEMTINKFVFNVQHPCWIAIENDRTPVIITHCLWPFYGCATLNLPTILFAAILASAIPTI